MNKIMITMLLCVHAFSEIKPMFNQGRMSFKKYKPSCSRNNSPCSVPQAYLSQEEFPVITGMPLLEFDPDVYYATIKTSLNLRRINGCKEQINGTQTIVVDTAMGRDVSKKIYNDGFKYAVNLIGNHAEFIHKDDMAEIRSKSFQEAIASHIALTSTSNFKDKKIVRRNSF